MLMSCEQVWAEVSNYIDAEVAPEVRAAIEEHLRECRHCTAVVDGTRNVLRLYADSRVFELPAGFHGRVLRRLKAAAPSPNLTRYTWMLAAAAAALLVGAVLIGNSSAFSPPVLRSQHAQPGSGVPGDMMVLVSDKTRTFHVAGCSFIHDKASLRSMTASEALRLGYAPCVRCLRKYVQISAIGIAPPVMSLAMQ
jgi:hypothetical protein